MAVILYYGCAIINNHGDLFAEIEDDYLEEDYNYVDGYDDYYADGEEYFDEYEGGPNRGDQSLVSPESKPANFAANPPSVR